MILVPGTYWAKSRRAPRAPVGAQQRGPAAVGKETTDSRFWELAAVGKETTDSRFWETNLATHPVRALFIITISGENTYLKSLSLLRGSFFLRLWHTRTLKIRIRNVN